VDGIAGAGTELVCVLPAGGGCPPLDLPLLDFAALETGAGAFEAEFIVLAEEVEERVFALIPAGCAVEPPAAATVFFAGQEDKFDGDAGSALAPAPFATDDGVADVELAADRVSVDVDNTISTDAPADGCRAVDVADAGGDMPLAAGGAATLLAADTTAGAEAGWMFAGAGAVAPPRACAFAAACARVAATAVGLLLSSSSAGKFGNALSGT
jgi:hypothetical protein